MGGAHPGEVEPVWGREAGRGGRTTKTGRQLLQLSLFVSLLEGKAVFLARDKHHLSDICHLVRHDVPYLFQKYVKESHGKDIRVVVVGGQVIGSMLRCSTDGRMQSNCFLGKMGEGWRALTSLGSVACPVSDLYSWVRPSADCGSHRKSRAEPEDTVLGVKTLNEV